MIAITAALVKELRERTGAGMMECKNALAEVQGDIELAIDNMRKLGQAKAAKKAVRVAAEGIILTKIAQEDKYGILIEINCETDFVAKDSVFNAFGHEIITAALKERIMNIDVLKAKFEEQRILLVSTMGENINIRRLGILKGNILGSYIHGMRIGVLVSAEGADEKLIKYIAMHIAACKPEYVNTADIPANIIKREYQIQLDIAMQSGKNHDIADKIVAGRMRKFMNDISLVGQHFVMEPKKTVSQILREKHANINSFIRFEVGEGINK